jgi:hypothetical protein
MMALLLTPISFSLVEEMAEFELGVLPIVAREALLHEETSKTPELVGWRSSPVDECYKNPVLHSCQLIWFLHKSDAKAKDWKNEVRRAALVSWGE